MSGLYIYDSAKAAANLAKHKVSFATAENFDWTTALVVEDDRFDYGERRYVAIGLIGRRLHVMVFTQRGASVRLISLRKANRRETRRYEQG
jgi:uncharacterized DUF497 family protein